MKKSIITILCFFVFIHYSLSDTITEKRKFVLYADLPIVPKIPIIEISTSLTDEIENKFSLSFTVRTLNVVSYLSDINGKGSVSGQKIQNNYFPENYKYDYTRKNKDKSVYLKYLDGKLIEEKFTPSFDKNKLIPIKEEQKNNTIDPATLFLRLLDINKSNLCSEKIKVYDGKRRYDIIFEDKKINDKTIECSATQVRIGGYKKDKVDPLTNTDLIKIRYKNSPKSEFIEFYAQKGLIEILIQEKFN